MVRVWKQGNCVHCGGRLRGRGVGYCPWCVQQESHGVVSETPSPLWLMAQGVLSIQGTDLQMLMGRHGDVPLVSSGSQGITEDIINSDMHVSPVSSDSDADLVEALTLFDQGDTCIGPCNNPDMHVSPISSDSDADVVEALKLFDAGKICISNPEIHFRSLAVGALPVLLTHDCLAGFCIYLKDYCRLALTCRHLHQHAVFLKLYRHWCEEWHDARLECYITWLAIEEQRFSIH